MGKKGFNLMRLLLSFIAAAAILFMAGCAQSQLSPERLAVMGIEERTAALLQQPQTDDIYAANLIKFSEYTFGAAGGDAFGLLRVINVTPDSIVVVTESAAWPTPQGAHDDLNGDFTDIMWDFDEEITIRRADLSSFQQNGSILEARRLTSEQIRSYLVN